MQPFIVSARKYRPGQFKDVVGQEAITQTLQNAIANNHLAQALLFTGPRGVGKTSCARILAKTINNVNSDHIEDFSFNIFELDAASNNSVEDIRSLTDQVRIPPQIGKYKIYIIDEVHMLSSSAFNAFLKTLEEPPAHAIFILATTEKHKIIPTILSRCQIFDFKRISVTDTKKHLEKICKEENIQAEEDALHMIAQKADGAMRDALSIFDRVVSFCGKNLTMNTVAENLNILDYQVYFDITDLLLKNDIPQVLNAFHNIVSKGFEGQHFITGLASHFRDLLVAKHPQTIALLEVSDNIKKQYEIQAKTSSKSFLIQGIDKANQCDLNYKMSKNQRLLVELTLMQIASIDFDSKKKTFIIPANFFNKDLVPPIEKIKPPVNTLGDNISLRDKSRVSDLSINGWKIQQQSLNEQKSTITKNIEALPKDAFSEEDLIKFWNVYIKRLEKANQLSLVSILKSKPPSLNKENLIKQSVPSQLVADQIKKIQSDILEFLKNKLNNYSIVLEIEINEKLSETYAHNTDSLFEKMKKENPTLAFLQKCFALDF